MSGLQRLWMVEPQALPLITTGIRHSYILNLATAAIAAVIGGEGWTIICGLTLRNRRWFSGTLVISFSSYREQLF